MQAGSMVRTFSRFATRQVLFAVLAVAAAMVALALLAEAMNSDGGTVYLAEIDAGQRSTGVPSLMAVGYGTAAAPAEVALMQFLISNGAQYGGGYIPPQSPEATPGAEEQAAAVPIVSALHGAGVAQDAVSVVISPSRTTMYYGPPGEVLFRVDVSLPEPDLETMRDLGVVVAQAAAEEGHTLVGVGALYGVADCTAIRHQAWDNAVADARTNAEHQADLLGVELGEIVLSQEALSDPLQPSSSEAIDAACSTRASSESQSPYSQMGITVPAFQPDVAPVASVSTRVSLAFEIVQD